jgi:plastocyanin
MVLNDRGQYLYVPDQLTIRAGDTVRWINVSGGPHNVQFRSDGVPGGAGEVLNAAMANRMGPLNGPLMVQPDQVYEISFAGAPAGVYDYTCTPHELLGMNATLTVQN